MCKLCDDEMKRMRILLASKVVGLLPSMDDTDLDLIVDSVVREQGELFSLIYTQEGNEISNCIALRDKIANAIRIALPSLTVEERFQLAMMAGAVVVEN